jgi:hypothetical protein
MNRSHVSLALAAVAAPLVWWWMGTPAADGIAPEARSQQAAVGSKPAEQTSLELQQRGLSARWGDLFATPARPPAPPPPKPVVEMPQPPKAPPLPYKYDGSGELQGKRFVYLARDGKSAMVHAGDTLDGTYAIDSVARDHAVLRYLPLGVRQVLMYQAGAQPPAELAAQPAASRPLALQVDMPAEVVLGQEFVVTLALPGAGPVKASVEVGYDVEVLSLVGAKQRRGREIVEVAGVGTPRAQLRFKVLADSPASTDINIQANATDTSGKRVPVSTPSTYTVSLVLAGGA